jgi:hypothetical protein
LCFRKSFAHSRKTQLPKGSHRRAGTACPSGKAGLSPMRPLSAPATPAACAGSYRHVLILFVHIDRGRGRMCFCKSLAHCRKTQLPKAAWTTAARGAHPASTIAAATRDILRAIMCRSPLCHAVITARRTEFGCRFSSSGVMSSRVLPSVQWRTCSRALSARMTTTQRPILCHLCHLVPLCHPV